MNDLKDFRQRSPKKKVENIPMDSLFCIECRKTARLSELVTASMRCRNCRIRLHLANDDQTGEISSHGEVPDSQPTTATAAVPRTCQPPSNRSALTVTAVKKLPCLTKQLSVYISLPFFLGIPSYYACSTSPLLRLADECKSDYEQWSNAPERRGAPATTTTSLTETLASCAAEIAAPPSIHPSLPATSGSQQDLPPPSVVKLQEAWVESIEQHLSQWKCLLAVACTLLPVSITNFTILGQGERNPLARSFCYFVVYRALCNTLYHVMWLVQFSRHDRRSLTFAIAWTREAKKPDTAVWRMLALPAAATAWAFLSYLAGFALIVWRDHGVAVPNSHSSSSLDESTVPVIRILAVFVCISTDVGLVLWAWKVMTRIGQAQAVEGGNQKNTRDDMEPSAAGTLESESV